MLRSSRVTIAAYVALSGSSGSTSTNFPLCSATSSAGAAT